MIKLFNALKLQVLASILQILEVVSENAFLVILIGAALAGKPLYNIFRRSLGGRGVEASVLPRGEADVEAEIVERKPEVRDEKSTGFRDKAELFSLISGSTILLLGILGASGALSSGESEGQTVFTPSPDLESLLFRNNFLEVWPGECVLGERGGGVAGSRAVTCSLKIASTGGSGEITVKPSTSMYDEHGEKNEVSSVVFADKPPCPVGEGYPPATYVVEQGLETRLLLIFENIGEAYPVVRRLSVFLHKGVATEPEGKVEFTLENSTAGSGS